MIITISQRFCEYSVTMYEHLPNCNKNLSGSQASLEAQLVENLPVTQETQFSFWVGKIPWRRDKQPTPVFLPRESQGQRSLVGYSP